MIRHITAERWSIKKAFFTGMINKKSAYSAIGETTLSVITIRGTPFAFKVLAIVTTFWGYLGNPKSIAAVLSPRSFK